MAALWQIVDMLKDIFKNALLAYQLKPKYYRFTSFVGFIGCLLGVVLAIQLSAAGFHFLGIQGGEPIETITGKLGAGVFTIVIFAFSIYFGCVLVAGAFSLYLVAAGKLSKQEALLYAFKSQYPNHWFKSEP